MGLKQAREASGLKAREVVRVLRQSGSRIDVPLYSHCERERVDLNAHDRAIAAELLHVPAAAVATAIPGAERASRTSSPPRRENAELRTRVPRAMLHKIDRAIKQSHKYIDRRDWMMQSVRQLLTEEGLL